MFLDFTGAQAALRQEVMFIDFTVAQAALRQEGNVYRFHRSTSRPPSGGSCSVTQLSEWVLEGRHDPPDGGRHP